MSPARLLCTVCALGLLASPGCENGLKNMYNQPKYKPLEASALWRDGRASRPLEPDTVVHSAGILAGSTSGREGLTQEAMSQSTYSLGALQRGRNRYDIYCAPCHGPTGDGNGYVTLRGFPRPPTYHSDRLRAVPDAYLFDVITRGYGVMYPYADRLAPQDRWAVVGYLRALQLAAHASLADIPQQERTHLEASP